MTIADILDGAFVILKTRTRDVLTLAAVFLLPVVVVSAVLLRDVLGTDLANPGVGDDLDFSFGGTILSATLSAISLGLLCGAMTHLVLAWYEGVEIPVPTLVRSTLRRSPAIVAAVVLVHVAEALGLIGAIVGAIIPMVFFQVTTPALMAESLGPWQAMKRSYHLTKTRFGVALGVALLVALIGQALSLGFLLVPEIAVTLVPDDWDWLARATGLLVSDLLVTPFTASVAILFYLDLRIRSEGIDVARDVARAFDA